MDYKRLVSYIYAYDNGQKDKNVGFAKVESKNGQCKMVISLKGVYTDAPENLNLYLFVREGNKIKPIQIGNVLVKNGLGNYQDILYPQNINGSGYNFDQMGGILIGKANNIKDMLASQWDDDEINLSDVSFIDSSKSKVTSKIEDVIMETNGRQERINTEKVNANSSSIEEKNIVESTQIAREDSDPLLLQYINNNKSNPGNMYERNLIYREDNNNVDDVIEDITYEKEENQEYNEPNSDNSQCEVNPKEGGSLWKEQRPTTFVTADEVELKSAALGTDSQLSVFDTCNKIDAFEDDYYYDCVEICPDHLKQMALSDQSIVNNSFLMHGYYNFRHILFGKVNKDESNVYFLGIPGVYNNRERFIASMYGFNNFKRSHRSDCRNPYFGYWYIEVDIG